MRKLYSCVDCQKEITCDNDYQICNSTWKEAHAKKSDILCLKCLKIRLRRDLTITDFTDYPINAKIFFGYSLKE
jgi:hypothetical protein